MAKEGVHPQYYPEARVLCSCGSTFTVGATVPEIRADICSVCHPFYTGEQRIVDTAGQVDRFMRRLEAVRDMRSAPKPEKKARKPLIETVDREEA
jgi:large subunit ribosomal protein L31